MRHAAVVNYTRLLEAVAQANVERARKINSHRRRTASRTCSAPLLRYGSASDPTSDYALFI